MLASPYQEGSTVVIVASAGGNDHHPTLDLDTSNNPDVTVAVGGNGLRK